MPLTFALLFLVLPAGTPAAAATTGRTDVAALVARFNAALERGDLAAAKALVQADGSLSEIETVTDSRNCAKPEARIETGSWDQQLALFTRPAADGRKERVTPGKPIVLIDGQSALVRQPVRLQTDGEGPVCKVQHLTLTNLGHGWTIRHLMLVDAPLAACKSAARKFG